ncbi:TetR/AcrR family transcriptional regulator [bacterium]|nr:TetR/AcrR family transcriptional regulator [bacterium]
MGYKYSKPTNFSETSHSFYATFKSKEQLFNRCIQRYTDLNFPFLEQALESESDYKVVLQNLLESYIDGLMHDDKRKGCFMANSCSLVAGCSGVEQKMAEHYSRIGGYFENFLTRKAVEEAKAKSTSATIITFLIGASQQSKINRNKDSYKATVWSIIALLG